MNLAPGQVAMNHAASMGAFMSAIVAAPKWRLVLAALVLVALIGWFEYAIGREWYATALYSLPIALIGIRQGRRAGLGLALLCSGAWLAARLADHPYQTQWGLALALSSTSFFFVIVAVAAAAVKAQWELGLNRAEMLERIRDLESEILQASEREQQRIGRELHDGLCQTLAGIAALSSALSRKLDGSPASAASAAEITMLLNGAIVEARDLARGLGPVGLQGVKLDGAIEDLALKVQHLFGVSCTVACDGPFPKLGREVEAHLFRIAQQGVNNALAHGRADRIEISVSSVDGKGLLRVQDNGMGVAEKITEGYGIGLHTMAYRARLIGGSLAVQRQPFGGTALTCVFPLP